MFQQLKTNKNLLEFYT